MDDGKTHIHPKGGHRIEIDGKRIFLTDDSGDRCEVQTSGNITAEGRYFSVPTVDGCSTIAGAEEAFIVAQYMQRPIIAGARRFEVKQVWHG